LVSKPIPLPKENCIVLVREKEFRYKKIADFQGYFARFELANGQKGWLDFNRNEYNDD